MINPVTIETTILAQTSARGVEKSICPSDVARVLAEDWRPLMGAVRAAAARLSRQGRIDILRKGTPIEPEAVRGVVRLRIRGGA